MDELARLGGVSKKTLYKLFEDKENLALRALERFLNIQKAFAEKAEVESSNAIEAHKRAIQNLSGMMREFSVHVTWELQKFYPRLWEVVEKFQKEFVAESIRRNLQRGIEEGLYEPDTDMELTPLFYVALVRGVLFADPRIVENYSFPHVLRQLIVYHLRAITTAKGKQELSNIFNQS